MLVSAGGKYGETSIKLGKLGACGYPWEVSGFPGAPSPRIEGRGKTGMRATPARKTKNRGSGALAKWKSNRYSGVMPSRHAENRGFFQIQVALQPTPRLVR